MVSPARIGNCSAKSVRRGSQASGGNGSVCWKPPSLHGPKTQILDPDQGDVVEHQRRDDLVDAELRPQDARDQAPQRPGQRSRDHHHRDDDDRRRAGRQDRREDDGARAPRPQEELALGADVPQAHPEGERAGEAGQDERRRLDQRVAEDADVAERGVEDVQVGADRVAARRRPGSRRRSPGRRRPHRWSARGDSHRGASLRGSSRIISVGLRRAAATSGGPGRLVAAGHEQADLGRSSGARGARTCRRSGPRT